MSPAGAVLWSHGIVIALACARLLPVAFLSPVLGGQSAPVSVRLALVLSIALWVDLEGGVPVALTVQPAWVLWGFVAKELVFGTAVGMVASLPFDGARVAGRLIDLFRGSSAEALLPVVGSREAVSGDALYQLVVALGVLGGVLPTILQALLRGFAVAGLGAAGMGGGVARLAWELASSAFLTGVGVGAPIAVVCGLCDLVLALIARSVPRFSIHELHAPVRILLGSVFFWLGAWVFADALLAKAARGAGELGALWEASR